MFKDDIRQLEEKLKLAREKERLLVQRPRRNFSAWTFEEATPKQLKEHLAEMQDMISGKDVLPKIVAKKTTQLNQSPTPKEQ